MPVPPIAAAFVLAAVHLASPLLRALDGTPRSIWLSSAGGVSVAYVFVHVLPELGSGQQTFEHAARGWLGSLEHHVYLIALVGLAVFYGLDRLALQARATARHRGGADETGPGVFWVHIGSFGVYNALVGYLLLHRPRTDLGDLAWFVAAMGLHFVVTDHSLQEHHKAAYVARGRFLLAGAVVAGVVLGLALEVSETAVVALFAFLAGGVVLNVLKEELPEERQSRYAAFIAGLTAYTGLLLALG